MALSVMTFVLGSRPARGGWIEISKQCSFAGTFFGPAPQGAGGLKFVKDDRRMEGNTSRPARGGWIEMMLLLIMWIAALVPPRKGRVD